ncbi:MAG: DNA double-strand break repair protein Mre11 [Haloarculaceae archaeon]
MTRVIHTGDTHIGYRQYHRPERRRDFLDAFRQVAEDAVADEVDAVVHAGDLFHDRRPDLQDVLGTLDVLRTLADAGIPFLAVVGNHEAKRDAQWLDLFASLDLATRLDDAPTVVGDTAFYGLDFVPASRRDALEYDFAPHDAEHAALVAHGLFEPFAHADWDTETVLSESSVDFDAVLLGDNHAPDTAEVADTWVTYCGSTERASAAERAERGYNIVEFDGEVRIARRGLPTREFVFVDVELGATEGADRVRERVAQHDLEDAVVVVAIEGEGDPLAPAQIEEFVADRGALVARVTDHRETAAPAEREVSFADPDEAVRERVRDLGLSAAARDVDETVRASKLADANVREAVRLRVVERLDAGDLDAFADAADEGAAADGQAAQPDGGASDDDREDASRAADADHRPTGSEAASDPAADVDDQSTMGEFR